MLETIREYALEQLEALATRATHCTAAHQLVPKASPSGTPTTASVWLDRLTTEHDNLRASICPGAWQVRPR